MADYAPLAASWVEDLRRLIAKRRRRRGQAIALLALCAASPPIASLLWRPPVLLVWNISSSAPVGLYRLHPRDPVRPGDMVVSRTPEPVRTLAAERHYLPANVPLVKRVAASRGDHVCAAGRSISINGRRVARRQERDGAGRPMPWWNGCRHLRRGEYLLLTDSPLSFDGRYFGVSRATDILGRTELLWRMRN